MSTSPPTTDPTAQVQSGLEGVVAFATEIAEPDKEGSALRYRGVDIEELVGNVPFEQVWGLLVDGKFGHPLPPDHHVRITRAMQSLRLVRPTTRSYYEVLREKLKWAER